jgi:DNA invertase Pin-like site-specific DNA recombinase
MIYGYARVSTTAQSRDGNSLEAQEQQLLSSGCQQIIKESYTGTKADRPQFKKLLAQLQPNDTLVVTKLDRFARNVRDGLEIVQQLIDKGIVFRILNMGTFDNTPQGRLSITMFLAFAEFERDMIIERTSAGKAIAKSKPGFTEGRPKRYTTEQLSHAVDMLQANSYTEVEKVMGISKSTLARERRRRNG